MEAFCAQIVADVQLSRIIIMYEVRKSFRGLVGATMLIHAKEIRVCIILVVFLLMTVILLASPKAHAQQNTEEPAISTDRPGQATTPSVVRPGDFQIETGFIFQSGRDIGTCEDSALRSQSPASLEQNPRGNLRHYPDLSEVLQFSNGMSILHLAFRCCFS